MAHPDELARELIKTTHGLAQRADARQTGVVPGYHAAQGITFDEQGRATYVNDNVTFGNPHIGARVYNNANLSIGNATTTNLTFNSEDYDTDSIHSTSSNTDRLTCNTAGIYLIIAHVVWDANANGARYGYIHWSNSGSTVQRYIGSASVPVNSASATTDLTISTIWPMAVGDFVRCKVYQDRGGSLNVIYDVASVPYSPGFMMQLIAAT